MEINFPTKELRALCEEESYAAQQLDMKVADALKRRLADIMAADTIHDVMAGNPQLGSYDNVDCFHIDLGQNFRLTVASNRKADRTAGSGTVDWTRVRRVRVVAVGPTQ